MLIARISSKLDRGCVEDQPQRPANVMQCTDFRRHFWYRTLLRLVFDTAAVRSIRILVRVKKPVFAYLHR